MDWNTMRQQWQAERTPPVEISLDVLRERAHALRRRVRFRDLLETLAAALVAPMFGLFAWLEFGRDHRLAAAFAGFLVLWALYVPVRLWRARRLLTAPDPDLSLRDYLIGQRNAIRMQARMSERAWLWYVAPCMAGIVGFVWSLSDFPPTMPVVLEIVVYIFNVGFTVAMIAFGVLIARLNRRAAGAVLRPQIEQIERHLASLTPEDRA